uniref:Putative membrane-associated er protein involved in stress response n=1 Tax=Amblyomma triste TaxID=251400 RepID=A0A023GF50_AMBTT
MAAQNMSTCLVIRAPNQKFGDQQVNCPLDWSVQQLKQHLSMVYPNNPRPEDQKLIYSGQLLEDEMTLKDVFQMDFGKIHILHLVCRSAGDTPEASSPSVPLAAISQPDISMAGGSVSTVPSTSSVSSASSDGLRHRSTSPGAMPNGQMPIALGMPPGTSSPEQLVQQVALAQQLYAHYFTQYMHLMHQAAAPVAGQAGAPRPPSPEAETPAAAAAAAPPVVRAAQDNRGPRMNAQGGPLLDEEEEEAAQRDWLDWVYTVSRATVLLSIVYFYSSFGRFLVVTGVALLMYLYQGGWFAAPRQQQLPEREHDRNRAREADNQQHQAGRLADEPREMPQGEAGPQQLEEAMDQDDNGIVAPAAPPPPPEPPVSPMTTAWTFVATFFTSLIPEQPPPVDAN